MEDEVVVCGVTGTVGHRVAAKLVERGVNVRGVARHAMAKAAPSLVTRIEADLRVPEAADQAIEGATVVYLTPPETGRHPIASERKVTENVIMAARRSNVQHLIVHTALKGKQGGTGARSIDSKKPIEQLLRASGVPFTILRPGWFLQNLEAEREDLERGLLRMPLPASWAFGSVSAEDVAEAAVGFVEEGPQGRGFDLHVEGGVTGELLCEAAEEAVGRPVRFEESRLDDFLRRQSMDRPQRELQKELFLYMRARPFLGEPDRIRDVLPRFHYTEPEEFLREELLLPRIEPPSPSAVPASERPPSQADLVQQGAMPPNAPGPRPGPGPGPPEPPAPHF